jgi:hypothetical protein
VRKDMKKNRDAILEMVVLGRITPLEAERLLLAWSEERESRWIFGACATPAVVNFVHAMWLQVVAMGGLHHVAGLLSQFLGGVS